MKSWKEGIVKGIMQRMKDQGMSDEDILETIEKILNQAKEDFRIIFLIHP